MIYNVWHLNGTEAGFENNLVAFACPNYDMPEERKITISTKHKS